MFKIKIFSESDFHSSCNICTKPIKPGRVIVEIRHADYEGMPCFVSAHKTCVDKFFAEHSDLPPENSGPAPSETKISLAVKALEMV